ncbi:MAG: hypothetical protein AAFN94_00700 [Pseudomonadota bacterium]
MNFSISPSGDEPYNNNAFSVVEAPNLEPGKLILSIHDVEDVPERGNTFAVDRADLLRLLRAIDASDPTY